MEGVRFYPPYFLLGLIEERGQTFPTIGSTDEFFLISWRNCGKHSRKFSVRYEFTTHQFPSF